MSCAQVHNDKDTKHKNGENIHQYNNALINESSPYLLQHAHNPVNWYPWGEEALEKAKKEDKMLIISIGYAACHWCHVMEHESFEDSVVADIMNKNFVCIKVDREERPDVDQIYMTACQLITKRGGWPLNAFALPDGRPFHAGTYFPKSDWLKVMNYFTEMYGKDKSKIIEAAEQLKKGIAESGRVGLNPNPTAYSMELLDNIFENWKSNVDFLKGGYNRSPKFPLPGSWDFMMQYHKASKNQKALEAVQSTLDNIAFGGIYDHLGGGFARYSTDANWKVPHFEKMLYDNGQLVSLYSQAYQLTKNPLYKKAVYETLEWIEREMTSKEGGFYSSLDADSEGEEGKFYIWNAKEIKAVLAEDSDLFMRYYNCTEGGNWEHKNSILLRKFSDEIFSEKNNMTVSELTKKITYCKKKLMKERDKRIRPGLDDKILTSWNALMLSGYLKAYRAFDDPKFLKAAMKNANFIVNKTISSDNRISRNYKDGKAVISGFLDDYAFVISAFTELYQVTFDEQWLYKAKDLTEHTLQYFFDEKTGMFFFAPDYNAGLIARKMEITDNVIPGSNSEMAINLYRLGLYFYDKEYIAKAKQMLANVSNNVAENPASFYNWGKLMLQIIEEPYEVAVVGNAYETLRKEFDKEYLPNVLFMGGKTEGSLELLKNKLVKGQTTVYVCQNKSCKRPVETSSEALKLMED